MSLAHDATLAVLAAAVQSLLGTERSEALARIHAACGAEAHEHAAEAWQIMGAYQPAPDQHVATIFSLIDPHAKATPPQAPRTLHVRPAHPGEAKEDVTAGLRKDLAHFPEPNANQLLFLLEKWSWAVPVTGPGQTEGLAWSELARITAGLAAVLAEGAKSVRLVGVDIPGIQKFLYTLSNKAALKTLRGRSFFIELLTEEVTRRLLAGLGLTRANIVYQGGGHLYLLAPATDRLDVLLDEIRGEINGWLFTEVGEQLFLALDASKEAPLAVLSPGFTGEQNLWREVAQALVAAKEQKGQALQRFYGTREFWAIEPDGPTCTVCHERSERLRPLGDDPDGPKACDFCRKMAHFGGTLPKSPLIGVTARRPDQGTYLEIAGTWYSLGQTAGAQACLRLNELDAAAYRPNGSVPLWLGNYAWRMDEEQSMVEFDDLAEASDGAKLLGVLRMDVDNLGALFQNSTLDFTRKASLSQALTRFFKLHLNAICRGELGADLQPLQIGHQHLTAPKPDRPKGRPVVIVYAGGDDLFLVGAWNQLLELAVDIRRAFQRFTGDRLTLSGGLIATKPGVAIHYLAKQAERAEDAAKDVTRTNGRTKDGFAPLYTPKRAPDDNRQPALPWESWEGLIQTVLEPLHDLQARNLLSRRFTFKLLGLVDYWQEHGPLYMPRLAYAIAKEEKARKDSAFAPVEEYLWKNPVELSQITPALRWLDLLARKEESRDDRSAEA